jgi:hypothetical protein
VLGSVLAMAAVGLVTGGGALLWAGQTQRQGDYLTSGTATYATKGYALASDTVKLPAGSWSGLGKSLAGKTRIRVTAADPARPVFVGIAPAAAVTRYLSGVRYSTLTSPAGPTVAITHRGDAVPDVPASGSFWTAHAAGTGSQTLVWTARAGNWVVVAMNPDGSAGLTVRADIGAALPGLPWIAGGLLAGGILLAIGGVLLIVIPVRRASAAL